jgi:hypothetical protein
VLIALPLEVLSVAGVVDVFNPVALGVLNVGAGGFELE